MPKPSGTLGVTFAYFLSYRAVDPYDYQVPFIQEQRSRELETWRGVLGSVIWQTVSIPTKMGASSLLTELCASWTWKCADSFTADSPSALQDKPTP